MESAEQYDQNLYSRQEFTYGAETMRRLVKLKVMVVGLGGVGVEVAKNLTLLGPARLSLCDPRPLSAADVEYNFYAYKAPIGTPRAESLIAPLAALNADVRVESVPLATLNELPASKSLEDIDVLVVCDLFPLAFVEALNARVRSIGAKLVVAVGLGLAGFVFDDFGETHTISDANGEECRSVLISAVNADGIVTTQEDKRHGLSEGDLIRFREVVGMEPLNGVVLRVEAVPSPYAFRVHPLDPNIYGHYERNGVVDEVKAHITARFQSLPAAFAAAALPDCDADFDNLGRLPALRFLLRALWQEVQWDADGHSRPPFDDAALLAAVLRRARAAAADEPDAEYRAQIEHVLEGALPAMFVGLARAELSPVSAFFGGIAAQEVVKATGKYTPIDQWFLHEFYSTVLPNGQSTKSAFNSRHSHQIAVLGADGHKALAEMRVLLVGAGALGCEFLKMLALMGACCEGQLAVVDDDVIEVSNLSRQFLFQREHVGKSKCAVACAAAKAMNPALPAEPSFTRLEPRTESLHTDEFWDGLSLVLGAVDNLQARRYVDQKAVLHLKPLLDAGTLGTKCNTQLVLPGATESYSDSSDAPEKSVPMCTLRSFPFLIEHVIEWAREKFNEFFAAPSRFLAEFFAKPPPRAELVKDIAANPLKYRELAEPLGFYLDLLRAPEPESYIRFAHTFFVRYFDEGIRRLLALFPADHRDKDGRLFWSSPKRPPVAVPFEAAVHAPFVAATVRVLLQVARPKVVFEPSVEEIRAAVANSVCTELAPPDPTEAARITSTTPDTNTDVEALVALMDEVYSLSPETICSLAFAEVEFEKDNDTNGHVDFVSWSANLRAQNYKIAPVERQRVKFIAGRIIPAIATTTAMVVGALGIELYKQALGVAAAQRRNFFSNLALPLFNFAEPMPPHVYRDKAYDEILLGPVKAVPPCFHTWSRTELNGPLTVAELCARVKELHGFNVSSLVHENASLWNAYESRLKTRLAETIEEIVAAQRGPLWPGARYACLLVSGEMDDGTDVISPYIKYKFAKG